MSVSRFVRFSAHKIWIVTRTLRYFIVTTVTAVIFPSGHTLTGAGTGTVFSGFGTTHLCLENVNFVKLHDQDVQNG